MEVEAVFVGIGGNLPHPLLGSSRQVLLAAMQALPELGIFVRCRSRWYRSAPVPPSDQPDYLNGVLQVDSRHPPRALLQALREVENRFGRVRSEANAARILDLDLLAWGSRVIDDGPLLILPHPRMHQRAFVLRPLVDLAPAWRHPVLGRVAAELLAALPPGQRAEALPDDDAGAAGCSTHSTQRRAALQGEGGKA